MTKLTRRYWPHGGKQPDTANKTKQKNRQRTKIVNLDYLNLIYYLSNLDYYCFSASMLESAQPDCCLYSAHNLKGCNNETSLLQSPEIRGSRNDLLWALLWMKRGRKKGGSDHVSPLGSLEAAAMKLSAALCNLSSYTVSDGWRGGGERGGGGGRRRQKHLAQNSPLNCPL